MKPQFRNNTLSWIKKIMASKQDPLKKHDIFLEERYIARVDLVLFICKFKFFYSNVKIKGDLELVKSLWIFYIELLIKQEIKNFERSKFSPSSVTFYSTLWTCRPIYFHSISDIFKTQVQACKGLQFVDISQDMWWAFVLLAVLLDSINKFTRTRPCSYYLTPLNMRFKRLWVDRNAKQAEFCAI